MEKEKIVEIDYSMRSSGGYVRLIGEKPFAKRVNKILGDYWVSTGRELNIEQVILEVLIEDYDKRKTAEELIN